MMAWEWKPQTWHETGSVETEIISEHGTFRLSVYALSGKWHWLIEEPTDEDWRQLAADNPKNPPNDRNEAERQCIEAFMALCQSRQTEYGRLIVEAGRALERALLAAGEPSPYVLRRGVASPCNIGDDVRIKFVSTKLLSGVMEEVGKLTCPVHEGAKWFYCNLYTQDGRYESIYLEEGDIIEPVEA